MDVLGEFTFTPALPLPIRLFLEAKFTRNKCRLPVVRNAHGIIHDINENFVHGPGNRLRKRYRYVYALFSTSGFTDEAQDFALAQQISLVDLSGASFAWLRRSTESAAADLDMFQRRYQISPWYRWRGAVPACKCLLSHISITRTYLRASEHEEHRTSRIRVVKKQFLSDIIIYRMEADILQTFQLQYHPGDLRRGRYRG